MAMREIKHLAIPFVYWLRKLVLVLFIITALVESCFSVVRIIKMELQNHIGDGFINHCVISFVEQEFLDAIPNNDIIVCFQNIDDRTCRMKL